MFLIFLINTNVIYRDINEITLRNGRTLNSKAPSVLEESLDYGWFYINIENTNQINAIEQILDQEISTSSILNPKWICLFLNKDQYSKLSPDYYMTPSIASDKLVSPQLLSSEDVNIESYLIHAHHDYFNHTNMTEYYTDYYVSHDLPDLTDPSILSVEPFEKGPDLLNRWATGLAQTETQFLVYNGYSLVTNRPIHEHGIRGDNVIITMLDSGIDTRLCYFRDDERDVPFNTDDLDHRKIVRYEALADTTDSNGGHGTHVAGILTGNALCNCKTRTGSTEGPKRAKIGNQSNAAFANNSNTQNGSVLFSNNYFDDDNKRGVRFTKKGPDCYSEFGFNNGCRCSASMYNGHAPNSKLYMVDGGLASDPTSLISNIDYKKILLKARQFHSKIMSNSWGFPPNKVGFRHLFDTIAYENPDVLLLFGAGNTRRMNDMYTPANSKNCLAIGGTSNSKLANLEKDPDDSYVLVYKHNEYKIIPAPWSESLFTLLKTDPIPNFRNLKLTSSFTKNNRNYMNMICFSTNSSCDVAIIAQQANCSSLILPLPSNDLNAKLISMPENNSSQKKTNTKLKKSNIKPNLVSDDDSEQINISNYLLSSNIGKKQIPKCSQNVNITVFYTDNSNLLTNILKEGSFASIDLRYAQDTDYTISKFNSGGPSDMGLMKPDLMAPGSDITSAYSSSGNVRNCDASSLLTKSGTSMAVPVVSAAAAMILQYFRDGFFPYFLTPSASLMKAMLINCAGPRDKDPTLRGGYGVIYLDKVLAFPESNFRLLIAESISISENMILSSKFTIRRSNKLPLCITLSWDDPPVSSESELPVFADLDLLVMTPSKKLLKFDDNRITSKRIFIPEAESGQYEIKVLCPVLYKPNVIVNFSIVVTGQFKQSGFLKFDPIPMSRKQCDIGKTGYLCEQEVHLLPINKKMELPSRKYLHFMMTMPDLKSETNNNGNNNNSSLSNCLSISVTVDQLIGSNIQIEIATDQTHKFGGNLLHFERLKGQATEFRINHETSPPIKKGQAIYLSIYQATEKVNYVNVEASILSYEIAENEENNDKENKNNMTIDVSGKLKTLANFRYRKKIMSKASRLVTLHNVDYKPKKIDYELIRNKRVYKLAPSKRPLPTADYNTNDLSELNFFNPDFFFFSLIIVFVVGFFLLMYCSFRDSPNELKTNIDNNGELANTPLEDVPYESEIP